MAPKRSKPDTETNSDSNAHPFAWALKNQIEAILYLKGQPLDLPILAELSGCSRDEAYEAVLELMDDYAHRDSALEVQAVGKGFALQLRAPLMELAQTILPPEIGRGALRTLATIILRGPLSLADLVELRGSGAYQHVAELVEKGFVTKQRQSGSRSAWLRVTPKFHQYFSVEDLSLAASEPEDSQLPIPLSSQESE